MSVLDWLGKKIIYFDGGMGTMLQAAGLPAGELPERWNLTHPQEVRKIHQAYIEAGAQLIKTNTFGANALKFQGTELTVEGVVTAAVANIKAAGAAAGKTSAGEILIALDLGPTGKLLAPYGDLPFERAVELYAQVVKAGAAAGADLVLIETMSDTYEAKAAILAAKENCELPVICTFTFDADGKLLCGADVRTAFIMAEGLGVEAVGFNCGLGPDLIQNLWPQALASTDLPLVVNPNAGLPVQQEGRTVFNIRAEEYAGHMRGLAEGGAAVLGGCCGTTPEYIRHLIQATAELSLKSGGRRHNRLTAVAAYGKAVTLGGRPVIIGERINPTGKKLLKEAVRREDMDYLCRLGLEQLERGASLLDVNVGVPGTDEPKLLAKAVQALQSITSVPLQVDTSNYEAMERSLRIYNGKPLLNSVNGKEESLEKVLPLAKKYGAVVVALCLDETGIPDNAAGRVAIADKIVKRAAIYGIETKNIIVDPLALTVSTGGENARIDLETIRLLRAKGIHTVMGVSNISFGLPQRDAINSAFFAMALEAGLSCAIINPQSEAMLGTWYAYCALSGWDEACKDYVAHFAAKPGTVAPVAAAAEYTLHEAIVKGLKEQGRLAAKKLLTAKMAPLDIINGQMIPALDQVGQGFENKTLFLPQLLMSADAAKAAFEEIKSQMGSGSGSGEIIVLATVQGDIHDIGKNIVKVLLENYGYRIVDLGKDVPASQVAEAVKQYQAKLVGLSALMTTSVSAMKATIAALRQGPACKVVVGGAVMTQEYAEGVGADAYAANAVSAVNFANECFKR